MTRPNPQPFNRVCNRQLQSPSPPDTDRTERSLLFAAGGAAGFAVGSFLEFDGDVVQKHLHDVVSRDAITVGLEIGHDTVTQNRSRHGLDVLCRDVEPTFQNRPRFGAQDEVLARSRSGSP